MHDKVALDAVGQQCGFARGEVFQDEEEKRLLFVMADAPSVAQRSCVYQWARRNGLKPVFIEGVEFAQ